MFQGSTDGEVFEDFIEQLLPHCGRWPEPKTVLIVDNASFNRTERIEQLCYKAGGQTCVFTCVFHVKIADFDCTSFIGSEFEACIPPYGRLLGSEAGSKEGTAGKLSDRTEQFALGSLFYYINYGIEVYDDQDFGEDYGPVIVERLQQMIFPKLDSDSVLDSIIDHYWHSIFQSVAALSESISQRCDLRNYSSQAIPPEEFAARRTCCLQLVEGGILNASSRTLAL